MAETDGGAVHNPYADDDVVYTVWFGDFSLTGRFYASAAHGPFWTMETTDDEWVAVNPRRIVTIAPAKGSVYADFLQRRTP